MSKVGGDSGTKEVLAEDSLQMAVATVRTASCYSHTEASCHMEVLYELGLIFLGKEGGKQRTHLPASVCC